MKILNAQNLPEALVRAVQNDPYDRGDADYSATDLITPPRITHLMRRHDDEIEVDVTERIWMLLGSAAHAVLERGALPEGSTERREERLYMMLTMGDGKNITISGKFDLWHDGHLRDWKCTSAWVFVYKDRLKDWEAQENIYAELFRRNDVKVTDIGVVAILRDFSLSDMRKSSDYPRAAVVEIPLELWSEEKAHNFIVSRARMLVDSENVADNALPYCAASERWERPTTWAVMKTGRKSALKVIKTSEQDAVKAMVNLGGTHVETRPGKPVRCIDYCPVNKFCNQYQEWKTRNPNLAGDDE